MSDAGTPGPPYPGQPQPGPTPPAWYSSPAAPPPPPGAKFQSSTKKRKGKSTAATIGFVLLAVAFAAFAAKAGFGQKKAPASETANENPARVGDEAGGPTLDDHWHAAYGIFLCKGYAIPSSDAIPDALGIHTHGDGLVHIHPFSGDSAEQNATLSVFLDQIGVTLDDDGITMPDGGRFTKESGCDGQPARLLVAVWPTATSEKPEVYEEGFDRLRFLTDGEVWTIAMVPKDGHLDKPESVANLANPGDLEPAPG